MKKLSPKDKTLTIVLPTYNEAGNINRLILAIKKATNNSGWKICFHVIDDDSPDKTGLICQKKFSRDKTVQVTIRTHERGLATAVNTGVNKSNTKYILLMDADFNHHPSYIPQMLTLVNHNPNTVINGSRYICGGGMRKKEQYIGSRLANDVARLFLQTPLTDFTGGFILIKSSYLKTLPGDWIFRGYGEWGLRLHFLLHRGGACLREIPTKYPARTYGHSKTNFFTYTIALIKTMFEIRLTYLVKPSLHKKLSPNRSF